MGKNSAPCRDCGDRSPGCHGICEKYQKWRAEMDGALVDQRIRQAADDVSISSMMRMRQRLRKMRRR